MRKLSWLKKDFAGGDAARPTAGVAHPLSFGKVGFAAAQRVFGALALRNVAIDAVNFRGAAIHRNGGGDQRHVQKGAILAPADQFGVDALAAPLALRAGVPTPPTCHPARSGR